MRTLTGLAVALSLTAQPALAQHHPEHAHPPAAPMTRPGGMSDDMAAMHLTAFQPDQLLAKRAELQLTADQVTRLERIAADATAKTAEAKASHEQHRRELTDALATDLPGKDAVAGHFQAAHAAMGAAHWAELEAGLLSMAVLTDAQRTTVRGWSPGQGMGCCKKP
jgi:hypothetical protein